MVGGNVFVGLKVSVASDGTRVLLLVATDGASVLLVVDAVGCVVLFASAPVGAPVAFAPATLVGTAVGAEAGFESGFVVFSPVGIAVVVAVARVGIGVALGGIPRRVGAKVVGPVILGTGVGSGVENVGSIDIVGGMEGANVTFRVVVAFGVTMGTLLMLLPLLSDGCGAVFLPIKYPAAIPTPRNTIMLQQQVRKIYPLSRRFGSSCSFCSESSINNLSRSVSRPCRSNGSVASLSP
jgi:hypothetical protein